MEVLDAGLRKRATSTGNSFAVKNQQNDEASASMTKVAGGGGKSFASDEDVDSQTKECPSFHSPRPRSRFPVVLMVLGVLHATAIAIFVLGFYFRVKLHTGEECDMTYSMRVFLEVDVSPVSSSTITAAPNHYKLYKFVDRRDPRYQHLLTAPKPLRAEHHWCDGKQDATTTRQIVLYIPGHWGSYTQSRSVGAHGIQLTGQRMQATRIQHALLHDMWSGDSEELDRFVYEVFAVDFAEQGGALHSEFLRLQTDYVAHIVQHVTSACQVPSITLVGHSMGGIVARMTPIRHPALAPLVQNIVTLATPHANPLYAFDKSIHDFFRQIQQGEESTQSDTLLVSISGGIRDEMIEPSASAFGEKNSRTVSILSPELLSRGALGMDHRAIVWCFDILDNVRKVLWTLALCQNQDTTTRRKKVEAILGGNRSFLEEREKMDAEFFRTYGFWRRVSMESAMLYNLPLLFGSFAIIGTLQFAYPSRSVATFLVATALGASFCEASLPATLVQCFVANSIFFVLLRILPVNFLRAKSVYVVGSLLGLFLLVQSVGLVCSHFGAGKFLQQIDCVLYMYCLALAYWSLIWLVGLSSSSCGGGPGVYAVLVALLLPVAFVGSIALMAWEEATTRESWVLLLSTLVPIALSCLSMTVRGGNFPNDYGLAKLRSGTIACLAVAWAPLVLARGKGFEVIRLLSAVSFAEFGVSTVHAFIRSSQR